MFRRWARTCALAHFSATSTDSPRYPFQTAPPNVNTEAPSKLLSKLCSGHFHWINLRDVRFNFRRIITLETDARATGRVLHLPLLNFPRIKRPVGRCSKLLRVASRPSLFPSFRQTHLENSKQSSTRRVRSRSSAVLIIVGLLFPAEPVYIYRTYEGTSVQSRPVAPTSR